MAPRRTCKAGEEEETSARLHHIAALYSEEEEEPCHGVVVEAARGKTGSEADSEAGSDAGTDGTESDAGVGCGVRVAGCGQEAASEQSTETGSDASDASEPEGPGAERPEDGPFTPQETLLIFDWDDTVLPTSWLAAEGLLQGSSPEPSDEQSSKLRALAAVVSRTLACARRCGRVIIITNAEQGWVEWSCRRFLPGLGASLRGLQVVSARGDFEPQGFATEEWKCLAFAREVGAYYRGGAAGGRWNVLSLGDSIHEHRALVRATEGVPRCSAKALRFSPMPQVETLVEQHELVASTLCKVVQLSEDLDIDVLQEG